MRGGGALQLGFHSVVENNSISIQHTKFISNSAGAGGAVNLFTSQATRNALSFTNCTFLENSALVGGAVYLKPIGLSASIHDCSTPSVILSNCSFIKNSVLRTAAILNHRGSQHVLESGIFHVQSFQIDFLGNVSFTDNRASGIVADSANINVLEGTQLHFINNTAVNGGALSLHQLSVIELDPGSQVLFDSNHASELGGAVYATLPDQTHFLFSHRCFIMIPDLKKINVLIQHRNNSAKYGPLIFTDTILPCLRQIGAIDDFAFDKFDQFDFLIKQLKSSGNRSCLD